MKQKWLAILCVFALMPTMIPFVRAAEPPVDSPTEESGEDLGGTGMLPEGGFDSDLELDLPAPEPTSSPVPETNPLVKAKKEDRTVLVGLAYGSSGLPGANLQNATGSGYRLGYLDKDRVFHQLGFTQERLISVAITQNVWYGDDNGYTSYSDKIKTNVMVGCWHVQHPIQVNSFEEAAAAAAQIEGGFPAWVDGGWSVRSGSYATRAEATAAAEAVGGVMGGTGAYGVSVIKRGTSKILFQFDGGADLDLAIQPDLGDMGKPETWFKGYKYYGLFRFHRHNGENLTVVNALSLDDYTECVISREMSASWPLEALKAQAVCARTYYESCNRSGTHRSYGFDICSTTHCQAYYGMSATAKNTAQAAAETTGLRVWYQGSLAQTYYFSSDGGATEDVRNIWSSSANLPYLCGVIDPYEAYVADKIPSYNWVREFTGAELTQKLRDKKKDVGNIVDFKVSACTPTGNVKSITFIEESGKSWTFSKTEIVSLLGLRSYHYDVVSMGETIGGSYYIQDGTTVESVNGLYAINGEGEVEEISGPAYVISGSGETESLPAPYGGTPTGEMLFTVYGSGWGHNIGMSQWGAYSMAVQGYNFVDILTFYYPGVEIY